jgi:hypothetical protein
VPAARRLPIVLCGSQLEPASDFRFEAIARNENRLAGTGTFSRSVQTRTRRARSTWWWREMQGAAAPSSAVDKLPKQPAQLASVGRRQRLKQSLLRGVDPFVQALEGSRAALRERDDIAAAVVLVADAPDETVALELVEDRVKVAAVDPQPTPERGLARRPLFCERREDGEVLPTRALLCERLTD